jgi:uncharacterized protein YukE
VSSDKQAELRSSKGGVNERGKRIAQRMGKRRMRWTGDAQRMYDEEKAEEGSKG